MKFLIVGILFCNIAFGAPTEAKRILPVSKNEVKSTKTVTKTKTHKVLEKEEDCDEKAKKPVEITPQAISLSGNTGCSLDTPSH